MKFRSGLAVVPPHRLLLAMVSTLAGRRAAVSPRMRLSRVLAQHAGHHPDLDVEFARVS
jgi:hypothetical protein